MQISGTITLMASTFGALHRQSNSPNTKARSRAKVNSAGPSNLRIFFTLLVFAQLSSVVHGWWLLAAQLSASPHLSSYLPDNFHCNIQPGLTRKQREICARHPAAMQAISDGLSEAIAECQTAFSRERWNCSTTFDFGLGPMKVATPEAAYVYAVSAGGASHALAKACAQGSIPECGCGQPELEMLSPQSRKRSTSRAESTKDEFIWAGCSDDVKYGNSFTRKFIDATEKQHMDARALMNLHNNRVGRKVLASNLERKCKCHGVSGSCVTKTCWKTVPKMDKYAAVLKQKYTRAQQVSVVPESIDLMVRPKSSQSSSPSRSGRFLKDSYRSSSSHLANRNELVYLDPSPDYCVADTDSSRVAWTTGRECFSRDECDKLCCGRGWETRHEMRQEPCRCKFIWCCDVKCDTCTKNVARTFCR